MPTDSQRDNTRPAWKTSHWPCQKKWNGCFRFRNTLQLQLLLPSRQQEPGFRGYFQALLNGCNCLIHSCNATLGVNSLALRNKRFSVKNQSSNFLLDSDRISSCSIWQSIQVPCSLDLSASIVLHPKTDLLQHDKQTTVILNYSWLLYKGTQLMEWRSIQAKRAKSKEWEDMAWYWLGSSLSNSKLRKHQRWAEPISLHVI